VECRYQAVPANSAGKIDLNHRPKVTPKRFDICHGKNFLVENIQIWKRICRRDFVDENALFFNDLNWEEDVLFSFKVLLSSRSLVFVDQELYFHIQHEANTTHALGRKIFDAFRAHDLLYEFLKIKNCFEAYERQFQGRVLKDILFNLNLVNSTHEKNFFLQAHRRIREVPLELYLQYYSNSKKKLLAFVREGDYESYKRYQKFRSFRKSILQNIFKINKEPHESYIILMGFRWKFSKQDRNPRDS
jgi:hypothetical protein